MRESSEVTFDLTTTTKSQLNGTTTQYLDDLTHVYRSPIGIIRICLCSVGLILNFLSVIAVVHIPHGFKNHIKLILSLAVSDSLTSVGVLFHYLLQLMQPKPPCLSLWVRQAINMAIFATLVNLLAMAADHYIAIMKPFQYPQMITPSRGNIVICLLWLVSILVGSSDFFVALFTHNGNKESSLCVRAQESEYDAQLLILALVLVVFVIMMVVYIKIYLVVRRLVREHQSLTQDETHSYKAIMTTFLILATFILCWIPYNTYQILMCVFLTTNFDFLIANQEAIFLINDILFLFLISNSVWDPIIYAVRLGQVQSGYRRMFRKIFKYCPILKEQDFRSMNQNNSIHRRSTHTTLVESDFSDNGRRQRNISDTGISMVPLHTSNINNTTASAKTIKFAEHYQKDNFTDINESEQEVEQRETTKDIEANQGQKSCKTTNRRGNEEDEKSSNTNVTPVSPVSDKDFWSETEASNLL